MPTRHERDPGVRWFQEHLRAVALGEPGPDLRGLAPRDELGPDLGAHRPCDLAVRHRDGLALARRAGQLRGDLLGTLRDRPGRLLPGTPDAETGEGENGDHADHRESPPGHGALTTGSTCSRIHPSVMAPAGRHG